MKVIKYTPIYKADVCVKTVYNSKGVALHEKTVYVLLEVEYVKGYEIPIGYQTDGASVPQLLWTLLPPSGRHSRAALLHDWLYDNRIGTRKQADVLFLEAMLEDGVSKWKAYTMYWGVRLFANYKWKH